MRIKPGLVIKIVVGIASLGIGIAEKFVANKDLDAKVAKHVAEALAKQAKES